MKNKFVFYYIGLVLVVMIACKISGTNKNNTSNPHKKTYQLSGNITYTSDYCGGAYPSNNMLQRLATPAPYPGKVFYIRQAERNDMNSPILYTIVTDSTGHYSINLPPGNYCMIDEFRKDTAFIADVYKVDPYNYLQVNDKKCLEDWFNSCFYGFSIKDSNFVHADFNIHRSCFRPEGVPCISYIGPMPP